MVINLETDFHRPQMWARESHVFNGGVTYLLTYLSNRCFEPSQPLGIISGRTETFLKRYVVERTDKAELRPQEQSEKTESCRENLLNEIHLKGP